VVVLMARVKRVGKLLGYMSMSTICADPWLRGLCHVSYSLLLSRYFLFLIKSNNFQMNYNSHYFLYILVCCRWENLGLEIWV
jgi:hypothetical protein